MTYLCIDLSLICHDSCQVVYRNLIPIFEAELCCICSRSLHTRSSISCNTHKQVCGCRGLSYFSGAPKGFQKPSKTTEWNLFHETKLLSRSVFSSEFVSRNASCSNQRHEASIDVSIYKMSHYWKQAHQESQCRVLQYKEWSASSEYLSHALAVAHTSAQAILVLSVCAKQYKSCQTEAIEVLLRADCTLKMRVTLEGSISLSYVIVKFQVLCSTLSNCTSLFLELPRLWFDIVYLKSPCECPSFLMYTEDMFRRILKADRNALSFSAAPSHLVQGFSIRFPLM